MSAPFWSGWSSTCVYFDTSALVKRYVTEPGTAEVDAILQPGGPTAVASWVTVVEVVSTLKRKEAIEGAISAAELRHSVRLLVAEVALGTSAGRWVPCNIGPRTTERARVLLEQTYMTPADALHIATAIRLQEQNTVPLVFVTADEHLAAVARGQQIYTFDPLKPSDPGVAGVPGKFRTSGIPTYQDP